MRVINEHSGFLAVDHRRNRKIDQNVICKELFGWNLFKFFFRKFSDVNVEDKPLGRITFQVS